MNSKSRKLIGQLREQLETIKAQFEEMQQEEQQKFENVPAALQEGNAAQEMETASSALLETVEHLDSAISSLDDIT
jgi:UDP-3-O-acyl-N-acetylglucosamine deacetylase